MQVPALGRQPSWSTAEREHLSCQFPCKPITQSPAELKTPGEGCLLMVINGTQSNKWFSSMFLRQKEDKLLLNISAMDIYSFYVEEKSSKRI